MRTSCVVVGLLLLAPMGVGAAEQPEDARAIVDKAIGVLGMPRTAGWRSQELE